VEPVRPVRQGIASSDNFDDLPRVLSHSSVLARFCVNTLFGDSAGDRLIWFLNRSNLVLKEDGRHHRPRRRQHLHIYRGTQRGGAPRVLGGQGALQSTILEGIQEKSARPGHESSRLRDALLHAQE